MLSCTLILALLPSGGSLGGVPISKTPMQRSKPSGTGESSLYVAVSVNAEFLRTAQPNMKKFTDGTSTCAAVYTYTIVRGCYHACQCQGAVSLPTGHNRPSSAACVAPLAAMLYLESDYSFLDMRKHGAVHAAAWVCHKRWIYVRFRKASDKVSRSQGLHLKKVSILAEGMGPLRSKSVETMRSPSLSQAKLMP